MSPTTAIVLGVLLVGGTYLVLRRQEDDSGPAGNQVCNQLGQADAKLGLACSLTPIVLGGLKGLGEAGADAAGDISSKTSSVGATLTRPLSKVVNAVLSGLSGGSVEGKKRICAGIRDHGRYGFIDFDKNDPGIKAWCAQVGVTW